MAGGSRRKTAHRRAIILTIVASQVVVALVTGLLVSVAYSRLDDGLTEGDPIKHHAKKKPRIGGDPINVLLLGTDGRDGDGNDIDGQQGIGERADVTILVHVSADRKTVYGVSLPRDAMVARPECTDADGDVVPGSDLAMFNAAFALGGPACTVAQVESLTGLYIDHYVSLDFNGFIDMVDAVDGVTVCIPEEIDDREHNIHFDAGVHELHGKRSLDYVRERSSTPNADIGRMKRQQAFIAAMINKVVSAGTLSRPTRLYSFLSAATASLTTDPGLSSLRDMSDLAMQMRKTDLGDIEFITVPFEAYPADPNRLQWTAEADELWAALVADSPIPAHLRQGVISANKPPGTRPRSGSPSAEDQPDSGGAAGGAAGGPSGAATGNSQAPELTPSGSTPPVADDREVDPDEAAQYGLCA